MNQFNSSSVRCPHCQLVNFASAPFCKRCRNNLQNVDYTAEGNTINININIPASAPQVRITPQVNQQQFAPQNSYEYNLQNQHGFQQWQQMNAPAYPAPNHPMYSQAVWRRGPELVMHQYGQTLPDRCVKCNDYISGYSSGAYVRQKFRWHNPLVYIALVSPLIYVILSLVLSHRVAVDIPLCHRHLESRKSTGQFLLGGGLFAVVAIIFFGWLGSFGFAFLIGFAALIGLSLGYEYSYKPLQISKIENDYIYLKGANNEYLSRLPYC